MASYRYRTYKFLYDTDLGATSIKRQRSYLDQNQQEITPITPLFRSRVVDFKEKVTGTSQGLRHVLATVTVGDRVGEYKINLPYAPGNLELIAHIREIRAESRVLCGDYFGENNVTGGKNYDR